MTEEGLRCIYEPLPCKSQEIRLLRVLSNSISGEEGLHCQLRVHNLQEDLGPAFKALSYCWGDEAEAKIAIKIHGVSFWIQPNLYDFLSQFRDEDASWIFVDAICINQTDQIEKSRQVPLMGDIYRNATMVIAWLGRYPTCAGITTRLWIDYCNFGHAVIKSEEADLIQSQMVKTVRRARDIISQGGTKHDWTEVLFQWSMESGLRIGNPPFSFLFNQYMDPRRYSFVLLMMAILEAPVFRELLWACCRARYWTRLWVVPEMVLARKLVFRLGSLAIDWRVLLLFLYIMFDFEKGDKYDPHRLENREAWDDNFHLPNDSGKFPTPMSIHMMVQRAIGQNRSPNAFECVAQAQTILSWKRQMQHRARGRHVPLYEALLGFGLQRCSVPHDSSYALIGLSRSRLKVNYAMPVGELRIRTLIDIVASFRMSCSQDPDSLLHALIFVWPELVSEFGYLATIVVVARATKLPVPTIVTAAARSEEWINFPTCGIFTWLGGIFDDLLSIINVQVRSKGGFAIMWNPLDRQVMWSKVIVTYWTTLGYLTLCKKANLPLTFGRGCKMLTRRPLHSLSLGHWEDWEKYADDIAHDVQRRAFL